MGPLAAATSVLGKATVGSIVAAGGPSYGPRSSRSPHSRRPDDDRVLIRGASDAGRPRPRDGRDARLRCGGHGLGGDPSRNGFHRDAPGAGHPPARAGACRARSRATTPGRTLSSTWSSSRWPSARACACRPRRAERSAAGPKCSCACWWCRRHGNGPLRPASATRHHTSRVCRAAWMAALASRPRDRPLGRRRRTGGEDRRGRGRICDRRDRLRARP